jgi:hypothetical protein
MDVRLALYRLAADHRLGRAATDRLFELAGLREEPASLMRWLPRGVAVLGAALGGLGVVFWIAAHWDTFGRFGRFALLQALVVAMCLAALCRPAARAPLGLLALLATGALFAYFGQTYQTGADPWQLFALWALLTLPLCLGTRSDVLWVPWALVVMTAISLWVHAHLGHRWRVTPADLRVHLFGWGCALALVAALGAPRRHATGAGVWSLRTALTLAVTMITLTAIGGLFDRQINAHYLLGLAVLGAAAIALAAPALFDVYGLSAVALGLDTLVVAAGARLLFEHPGSGEPIGRLLLLGLVAAGLLGASVAGVSKLASRAAMHEAQP